MSGFGDKIQALGDATVELVQNLISDFQESNRDFKIKISLIGAYVLVSSLTILVFPPPSELNEIGARILMGRTEIIGGRFVSLANESSDDWADVVVRLNERFEARAIAIKAGKKESFYFQNFRDGTGMRPSENLSVTKLRVDCSEGAFERDFTKQEGR